ncbi:HTH-type transcriptional regulator XynR [Achromobacter animicus]|uniref:HTH-type transcriptional regulator XynR n=1 Tax=Achromobacter animicus TaxID=1389935 RepID=A0A6S6Z1H6_9BURK|nr:IclR family transcriptional regulator [Achromobacter animicus]CAB3655442.1 HTH-type transcriptional regulator XynR [Achromobacter animicus]
MLRTMNDGLNPDPDETPAEEGVVAVRRAMSILAAFGVDDTHLSLAELSRRTGCHRSTVLRLARTLAMDDYLAQREDGTWRLARAAGWLGACYQATFNIAEVVQPVLRELSAATGESATFYVREGKQRICMARVEGPKSIRHHVRVGAALPLELGSPGRVLLAFAGEPGEPYESVRRAGYMISLGERDAEVSSISAPVYGINWTLQGAICISGPISRLTESVLLDLKEPVLAAASRLSRSLMGLRRTA